MGAGNGRLFTGADLANEESAFGSHEDLVPLPPSSSSSSPFHERGEFHTSHPVIATTRADGVPKERKSQPLEFRRSVKTCASLDGESNVFTTGGVWFMCGHLCPSRLTRSGLANMRRLGARPF